jgi:hypothetical protein
MPLYYAWFSPKSATLSMNIGRGGRENHIQTFLASVLGSFMPDLGFSSQWKARTVKDLNITHGS